MLFRSLNLGQMRADGELTKEQYQKLYSQAMEEHASVKRKMERKTMQPTAHPQYDFATIQKGLNQLVDISSPKISEELIDEFVEAIVPSENYTFRWKMCFGNSPVVFDLQSILHPDVSPALSFTIDFEDAKQFRISNALPTQFRKRDWHDLKVEIFI